MPSSLLDKSFTNGYNRAKTNHEAPPEFSQCGQVDLFLQLFLQLCPHQGLRDLREKAFDDQGTALSKILKDAPGWKRPLFTALKDLCWARVAQTPDETEHLWRGLLPGDISQCVPDATLLTALDSEEQLRSLRRDISDFLQPLVSATQLMISVHGQLFHSVPPPSLGQAAPALPHHARPVGSPILPTTRSLPS